jgi:hypothetical protein
MLYTVLSFFTLFLSVFSQEMCVRGTPTDSIYWWNGNYEVNGTFNGKSYYTYRAPGETYYLYYANYSSGNCPFSVMDQCWCFDTYAPGYWTVDCELAGVGDTPDAVTNWYADATTYDSNDTTFADFTITTSTSCDDLTTSFEGNCYRFEWSGDSTSEPALTGNFKDTEKIYWGANQYKQTVKTLGINLGSYYMFISTGSGGCNETRLNQENVNYCWCFDTLYRAGNIGSSSCDYSGPISAITDGPQTVTAWYDIDGVPATSVSVVQRTCSNANQIYISVISTILLIFYIFVTN